MSNERRFHRLLDVKYGEACLYYRREGDTWEPSELEHLMEGVGVPHPTDAEADAADGNGASASTEGDEEEWQSLGTSNPRVAAENLANIILSSLQAQCVTSHADMQHSLALLISSVLAFHLAFIYLFC
jgi:hypothetical protein